MMVGWHQAEAMNDEKIFLNTRFFLLTLIECEYLPGDVFTWLATLITVSTAFLVAPPALFDHWVAHLFHPFDPALSRAAKIQGWIPCSYIYTMNSYRHYRYLHAHTSISSTLRCWIPRLDIDTFTTAAIRFQNAKKIHQVHTLDVLFHAVCLDYSAQFIW